MKTIFAVILLVSSSLSFLWARGAGVSTGKNLLQAPGARAASLAEAFSATPNDATAFAYNPALLATLENSHASFLHQQGIVDDSFSHLVVAAPIKQGSLGVSIGYYDGGNIELFTNGVKRDVDAQTDLIVSVGYGFKVEKVEFGVTGKYISSELGEFADANAGAVDFGIGAQLHPRLRLGAALQNIGSKLKFVSDEEDLPRLFRAGASYIVFTGRYQTSLMVEAPYLLEEEELRPAVGLETRMGPIALRLGYKSRVELSEFTVGAGFALGAGTLDYAFGIADDVDDFHRVSLGIRFRGFNE